MKILLVQPPYDLWDNDERQAIPPLGLAYIAAVLERDGHEVRIIDSVAEDFQRLVAQADGRRRHGLSDEDLVKAISEFGPRIVGVSCLFSSQIHAANHVCRLVKQTNPTILTVMGGAHPSAVPHEVLDEAAVDVAAIGEGELTMLELVRSLERGRFPPDEPNGMAYRRDGAICIHSPHHLTDLDWLPLPARHLLPMQRYFKYRSPHGGVVRRHPCTNMITSRGCPAHCVFCSIHTVWGRKFRCHSAERVIEEIELLTGHYGVREIQFEDDNITLNKQRMIDICRAIIERRIDLTWTGPNGLAIWALDEKLLEWMRRAGCYHLTIAVESGSQDVLKKIIRKPIHLDRVYPIVKAARRLRMGVSAFFVVGFPGETKQDITKTFDFAMNMGADSVHFFTATPYPGTELLDQCVSKGLITTPVDYAKLRVGLPTIDTPAWTAAELSEMTRAAQARFYRRTAIRSPVRCFSTVTRKLVRNPGATLQRARDTLFPRRRKLLKEARSPAPA